MATIHDVAAYIVQHFRSDITPMKLQSSPSSAKAGV